MTRSRLSLPFALAAMLGGMTLLAGCGQDRNTERSTHRFGDKNKRAASAPPGGQGGGQVGGGDVDALRTLPYVGFSDPSLAGAPVGVATWDRERTGPGYTLLTSRDLCISELIGMSGNVVNSWTQPGVLWANTKLLPNGDLLVVGADKPEKRGPAVEPAPATAEGDAPESAIEGEAGAVGGAGAKRKKPKRPTEGHGYLLRLSWNNELLWKRSMPVHHDVSALPDGRILVLTASLRQIPELAEDHVFRDDEITILSPAGDKLESLSLFELLRDAPEPYRFHTEEPWFWEGWFGGPAKLRFQEVTFDKQRGGTADLLHTNTVQPFPESGVSRTGPLYAPGNVLITTRHQDLVSIVSLTQKKVLWAWGPGEVMGPHDGSWLPNGNILIFDNGLGRDWSRVIELDPLTGAIAWEYVGDPVESFYTATRGANQRLANGNTLVTESDKGHLFEILPDGTKVWDFWTPHRNQAGQLATITRASRFADTEIAPLLSPENQ